MLAVRRTIVPQYPLPRLRSVRICSVEIRNPRSKFPAVEDIIGWLRPRVEAEIGPYILLLDYCPGQERPAFVDPRLLALVPEVRYLDPEDPTPELDE